MSDRLILGSAERAYRVAGPLNELSMPVTAKLSRKFYERFGDELTNELVFWVGTLGTLIALLKL